VKPSAQLRGLAGPRSLDEGLMEGDGGAADHQINAADTLNHGPPSCWALRGGDQAAVAFGLASSMSKCAAGPRTRCLLRRNFHNEFTLIVSPEQLDIGERMSETAMSFRFRLVARVGPQDAADYFLGGHLSSSWSWAISSS
jgi:hypothetical protein